MGLTPLAFTGVSKYSADFQTILNRAVSIASLPLKGLQNQQADLVQKKVLTSNLEDTVSTLASSLSSLASIGDNKGLAATSSNSSKVAILNSTATTPVSYTISDITSIAKAASETSLVGYANSTATAVSATGTVKLTVGANDYTINLTPGTNNLVGLRNAINNLGIGVTASVLTTGTGAAPNFLSVSANSTGETVVRIVDDPTGAATGLLTQSNQGADAVFKLNGVPVRKSSNTINDVVPGVSFSILGTTSGDTVTLSLTSDRSKLSSALQSFVASYNEVRKQLDAQIGPGAGQLSGDFLIREIQNDLRQLTSFQGSGAIKNFSDLGLELSSAGELSLNTSTFDALSNSQIDSGFTFAGSSVGGLGSLSSKFQQLSNPISGLIKVQLNQYETSNTRITKDLAGVTDRISLMQTVMAQKLQAADSLLAQMESQQNVLTASLQSLIFTLYGKQQN
jgi:flagellar hook-associated protein 2